MSVWSPPDTNSQFTFATQFTPKGVTLTCYAFGCAFEYTSIIFSIET